MAIESVRITDESIANATAIGPSGEFIDKKLLRQAETNADRVREIRRVSMFDFYKISSRLYVVRKNGLRVTEAPLTKRELVDFLISMPLTESELTHIERFYSDAS